MAKKREGGTVKKSVPRKAHKRKVKKKFHMPFSKIYDKLIKGPKSEYRRKEEEELRRIEERVRALEVQQASKKIPENQVPTWFYIASIFAAFLFAIYVSIFATIHFESIDFMNITIVFLFIAMVSYFLIAGLYFFAEKKTWHTIASALFLVGVVSIMVYAFKAADTSDLVKFSIIYAIIVAAISSFILIVKKK